ncbi:MAG: hypothetical protein FJ288_01735 [Planctomycetes bacterium]|nr:hypothetical protein [Planctomycetota bacterium]
MSRILRQSVLFAARRRHGGFGASATGLILCCLLAACASAADAPKVDGRPYLDAARKFADAVLQHGRDTYGPQKTPLFVDGLHAESLQPVRWQCRGETWVLSNFASQQPLIRLLDGLTGLTGEEKYRKAAEDAARYALERLVTPNGLLYWGGHMAWDLDAEKPVGQYADVHEMKGHQPHYVLMHRVNPAATRKVMETVWASHVLDWPLLDYNRHGSVKKPCRPQWDHEFREAAEVPFPTAGGNLSFCNVTPSFIHAGVNLAVLDNDQGALAWTHRLALRWQQGRDPKTGLCGGQLSYRKDDRARDALGHVHPAINEAKIVASYHQVSRYHHLPLVQMQAADTLSAAGGKCAEVGRDLLRWALEDLKVYARACYDPKSGKFIAMMTDGTPLAWQEAKTGYYEPASFAPRSPDGMIFWAYCRAYRLTGDAECRRMVGELGRRLDLGDLDRPADQSRDRQGAAPYQSRDREGAAPSEAGGKETAVTTADWRLIYGLLELADASGMADVRPAMLRLACRVADNLLKMQSRSGLFPRSGREWAQTGDEVPLALAHLAAAIQGRRDRLPPAAFDTRFFHCEFHGPLEEHQKKRGDARTYDHYVFYGGG